MEKEEKRETWTSREKNNHREKQFWLEMRWGFAGGIIVLIYLLAKEQGSF